MYLTKKKKEEVKDIIFTLRGTAMDMLLLNQRLVKAENGSNQEWTILNEIDRVNKEEREALARLMELGII